MATMSPRSTASGPLPKNSLMKRISDLAISCPRPNLELMIKLGDVRLGLFSEAEKLGGSHKFSLVVGHLYDGAEIGGLRAGDTVVIPSSGSTGITAAHVCRRLGLRCVAVIPEGTSTAKHKILSQAGAVIETAPTLEACRQRASDIAGQSGHSLLDQFAPAPTGLSDRSMAQLHFAAVKAEFGTFPDETIVTFGTGTSALSFRREVIRHGLAVRITDASILGGVSAAFYRDGDRSTRGNVAHKIEGINTGFVPNSASRTAVDGSIEIHPAAAFATCLELMELGLDCGPSSGLAIYGALERAQRRQEAGAAGLVSVAVYDRSSRYPDTLLNPQYIASLGPALLAYRRRVRIFVRSEIWMSLDACGWHDAPAAPANDSAPPAMPTMWPMAAPRRPG